MGEPLITTELESAILQMYYQPTPEWAERASEVAFERDLTMRESRRILDVLYDVCREFTHIELGLID